MDITFDCYGTLLDTRPIRTQFMTFSARHGIDGQAAWHQFESWEDRLMYGETTLPFTTLLKRDLQYLDMTFRTNSLFSHYFHDLFESYVNLQPWPEVIPALQQLRQAGHRIIIMSNSTPDLMTHHFDQLEHQVDQAILPEQTHCYKPTLSFFTTAETRFSQPHLHVAMGYWWDIVPCHKLGWPCVWINRQQLSPLPDITPTYSLPNLTELSALVEKIAS